MTQLPQIIAPHEARRRLEEAIRRRLGDDWDDELTGWVVVSRTDYIARLTRGRMTIDFEVDLAGEISVTEKGLVGGELVGRNRALLILGLSIFMAFVLARLTGNL